MTIHHLISPPQRRILINFSIVSVYDDLNQAWCTCCNQKRTSESLTSGLLLLSQWAQSSIERAWLVPYSEADWLQCVGIPLGLVPYQCRVKHSGVHAKEGNIAWCQRPLSQELHSLQTNTYLTQWQQAVTIIWLGSNGAPSKHTFHCYLSPSNNYCFQLSGRGFCLSSRKLQCLD
jgi:hypothetical protein